MQEILEFIVAHCSFLWASGQYRIVESQVTRSFGGDAYLVISSNGLRLRFVRDRSQLFLDFQEGSPGPKDEWYSIDLVRRLITGERQSTAELNEDYVGFLQDFFGEIESRFSDPDVLPNTKQQLHDLKRVRAKELFG